jgi:hypothetical protein
MVTLYKQLESAGIRIYWYDYSGDSYESTVAILREVGYDIEGKSGKRLHEKASEYRILAELDKTYPGRLRYQPSGQPYIEGECFSLSISHSGTKVFLLVRESGAAGIDVENVSRRVYRFRHKYMNERELSVLEGLENEDKERVSLLIWCVKESLYKVYGRGYIDYVDRIRVKGVREGGELRGEIVYDDYTVEYELMYEFFEGMVVVYVV